MNHATIGLQVPGAHRGETPRMGLRSVAMQAALDPLLTTVTVDQEYVNRAAPGDQGIEVVYTFPLPLEATLTDLRVTLGERTLVARAAPHAEASEQYEDSVSAGDSAVLLTESSTGLYTMNLGNLMPGEMARITFTYSLPNRWHGQRLALCLPTTIAPRYGNAADAGLAPHEEPPVVWDNGVHFDIDVRLAEGLAGAGVTSATHALEVRRSAGGVHLGLADGAAAMDRDLVLEVQAEHAPRSVAMAVQDGDAWWLLAAFQPQRTAPTEQRAVTLLIDCSGSMGGDSMAQARQGALAALQTIPDGTQVDAIAFGSRAEPLLDAPQTMTPAVRASLQARLQELDATLGGTETGTAVRLAMTRAGTAVGLLLLTDGHVYASDLAGLVEHGSRVFPVAVGAAANLADLGELAQGTGGHCERITPLADTSSAMRRQAGRMREAAFGDPLVGWGGARPNAVAADPAAFGGDTWLLAARLDQQPGGELELRNGEQVLATAAVQRVDGMPDLPRLVAGRLLAEVPDEEATALAVQHNLVSRFTSMLVVDEREVKAGDLPELVQQAHTRAAGFMGAGSVMADMAMDGSIAFSRRPAAKRMHAKALSAELPSAKELIDAPEVQASLGMDYDLDERLLSDGQEGPDVEELWGTLAALDGLDVDEAAVVQRLAAMEPVGRLLWLKDARYALRGASEDRDAHRGLRRNLSKLAPADQLDHAERQVLRRLVERLTSAARA